MPAVRSTTRCSPSTRSARGRRSTPRCSFSTRQPLPILWRELAESGCQGDRQRLSGDNPLRRQRPRRPRSLGYAMVGEEAITVLLYPISETRISGRGTPRDRPSLRPATGNRSPRSESGSEGPSSVKMGKISRRAREGPQEAAGGPYGKDGLWAVLTASPRQAAPWRLWRSLNLISTPGSPPAEDVCQRGLDQLSPAGGKWHSRERPGRRSLPSTKPPLLSPASADACCGRSACLHWWRGLVHCRETAVSPQVAPWSGNWKSTVTSFRGP